ncbi:MAG TPA: polymer-forming cytoskeletal protein [Candidatus Methylomirabilis sp.]|nr:polymer-forming cytoskeletal protein [Candidatus Methylomirabilis sp.]
MFRPKDREQSEVPQRRLEDTVGEKETVIAQGTEVRGRIQGPNAVRVAGYLEGELSSDGLIWIDKQGEVQGTVTARDMIIEGQLKGDVAASGRIEIRASGRVLGNLRCQKLAMAEGCFFRGAVKMPGEETQPLTFVEKRQSGAAEGEPETRD